MNEKKKCPNCGLLIDSDMKKCPYCGYIIPDEEKEKEIQKSEPEIIEPKISPKTTIKKNLFAFQNRRDVSSSKELSFFFIVLIGFNLMGLLVSYITGIFNSYFLTTTTGNAMLNFSIYLIIFGVFGLILQNDIKLIFKNIFKSRTYLYGIAYGFLIIFVNALYSMIVTKLYPGLTSNNNESSIDSIVAIFPILSTLIFGIVGPICEEIGYRVGLFSFIRKYNRVVAYILTALIFGFIHFDFFGDMKVEFLNLPSYIISGLLFCYVYDKEGPETSIVAHITNNLFAIIMTIIGNII
jgi:membrane protease YdiL (CAAX protease family)